MNNKHLDSTFTYIEYPIEKMTLQEVYFDEYNVVNLKEQWVIVEEPNEKYSNIVLVEKENFKQKWLFFFINYENKTYHIYLTKDIYDRYKSGYVIYSQK